MQNNHTIPCMLYSPTFCWLICMAKSRGNIPVPYMDPMRFPRLTFINPPTHPQVPLGAPGPSAPTAAAAAAFVRMGHPPIAANNQKRWKPGTLAPLEACSRIFFRMGWWVKNHQLETWMKFPHVYWMSLDAFRVVLGPQVSPTKKHFGLANVEGQANSQWRDQKTNFCSLEILWCLEGRFSTGGICCQTSGYSSIFGRKVSPQCNLKKKKTEISLCSDVTSLKSPQKYEVTKDRYPLVSPPRSAWFNNS